MRCLLLVMYTYPFAEKALTLHLARGEGRERYYGCNLMCGKVLTSSHQHLMAEAPAPDGQDAGDPGLLDQRPAHRRRRVGRHDLPDDQKIKQAPDRRQMLLDRGGAIRALHGFDVGGLSLPETRAV